MKWSGKSWSCFFSEHSGPEAVSDEILATVYLRHVLLQHYLPISGQCHVCLPLHMCPCQERLDREYACIYLLIIFVFFSEFFKDKYLSDNPKEAAYIAGAIYDCSLGLTVIFGWFIVSDNFICFFILKYKGHS